MVKVVLLNASAPSTTYGNFYYVESDTPKNLTVSDIKGLSPLQTNQRYYNISKKYLLLMQKSPDGATGGAILLSTADLVSAFGFASPDSKGNDLYLYLTSIVDSTQVTLSYSSDVTQTIVFSSSAVGKAAIQLPSYPLTADDTASYGYTYGDATSNVGFYADSGSGFTSQDLGSALISMKPVPPEDIAKAPDSSFNWLWMLIPIVVLLLILVAVVVGLIYFFIKRKKKPVLYQDR